MPHPIRRASGVLLVLFTASNLLAQAGQAPRPGSGRPPGPGPGMGGPPGGAMAQRPLKVRPLEDKPLDEKEQKKYDAAIAGMQKNAGRTGSSANHTAELTAAFRLGSTQLKYGQEQAARTEFEKAWQLVPPLYAEPKTAAAAAGPIRTHLRELQTLAAKDPELALTFMFELDEVHRKALEAVKQERSKPQVAQPLAQFWFQFMQMGQLDKETMGTAAFWVMQSPQIALADRPLPPDQQTEYQSQLTAVTVDVSQRIRQLAERQLGRPVRPPQIGNTDAPETVDPATAQLVLILDQKRGPLSRFMEADIHFRYGQLRDGTAATQAGWRELLEFYRSNPGSVSPIDTEIHYESLQRIAANNPVVAFALLDQVDVAYRNMLRVDRFFGVRTAELWAKMVEGLPLAPPALMKAAFWLEHVSKQHKDAATRYAASLADIKHKLEEAGVKVRKDDDEDDDGKEDDDGDDDDNDDDNTKRNAGGRRGLNVPKTIDTLKSR